MTDTDTICGKDRYENSPSFGQEVVEIVILWKRPGDNITDLAKVSGAVAHGDPVEVLDKKLYKRTLYAKIKCDKYPTTQEGWVSSVFLEGLGKDRHV